MHKLVKKSDSNVNLSDIYCRFLNFRKQRVVLNRKYSAWTIVLKPGTSRINTWTTDNCYIDDLSDDLKANV